MPKGIPKSGINKGWFKKRFTPWNKSKKGVQIGWSKGFSKENNSSVRNISIKLTGRKLSKKHCESISKSHLGYKMSEIQKSKIGETIKKLYEDASFRKKQKEELNRKEVKEKCGFPHIGRKHSKEEKEKRSFSLKKHYFEHPETKDKTKHIGKDNGMWNNGSSFNPYSSDWNKNLKERIKERDGNRCKICQEIKKLVVHHIDYNKLNSLEKNLVTLCKSCHGKTNEKKKRKKWEKYFNSYIKNRK